MGNIRIPFYPDKFYHLYSHSNGKDNLFINIENYNYFLKKYFIFLSGIFDTFAYCLMPNHFHFLVKTKSPTDIGLSDKIDLDKFSKMVSQEVGNWLNSYTKSYNKKYSRRGSLFTQSIRRKEVNSIEYLRQLTIYIHQNPVKDGFAKNIENWVHSSYNTIISSDSTLLNKNIVIDWFDDKENFIFCNNQLNNQYDFTI